MRKALFIVALLTLTGFAQVKPQLLTDTESQQWSTFAAREKAAADALNRAKVDLIDVPVGEASITIHSHYQSAWLALQLVRSQRGEWLAKLQAAKKCESCTISEDGKTLLPPKAAQ